MQATNNNNPSKMMGRRRSLIIFTSAFYFLLLSITTLSSQVVSGAEEGKSSSSSSLDKRQGMVIEDGEDQLAVESQVHDQMAVESSPIHDQMAVENHQQQHQVSSPIPVPMPMRTVPGSIVFPMPNGGFPQGQMRAPQQQQQQASASHAIPQGLMRQHIPHPTPAGGQVQVVSTPSGDLVIQRAKDLSQEVRHKAYGGGGHQQQQHPMGLMPPMAPQNGRFHPQPIPRQQQHGLSSNEITKNIIRELFDKKPPQGSGGRGNNGGFFGPPPHMIQGGQSHPKIMARPGPGPPPPPHHSQQSITRPNGNIFTSGKEIALHTNDLNAEGGDIGPALRYQANGEGSSWPSGPDSDTPKISSLEVKCERNVMRVFIAFDKPFHGVIFSKGHYHNVNCIHLPAGLGHTSANFDIGVDACGTQGSTDGLYTPTTGSGSFFENTVIIQYDSQVQEVWDQARKLRCTWHDQYEKSVTFRPFPVDMLDVVRADFAGDNVGCWMQIQVGKGPWASEVSGLVKIGQTMTMVLAIKDDDNKFDMMVRNCLAHDGQRAPIQLVDQYGCITRPKLMSPFTKIKNFGASATVLSYAHFQAFKFPDSMEVHFQCTIQICRHQCPEQCSQPGVGRSGLPGDKDTDEGSLRRRRRSPGNYSNDDTDILFEYQTTFKSSLSDEDVGLNKVITVISPEDLDNMDSSSDTSSDTESPLVQINGDTSNIVCMSTMGFAAMITLLIGLLLMACLVSAVIVIKRRPRRKGPF